jgi:AcrR family transcriptional regulator
MSSLESGRRRGRPVARDREQVLTTAINAYWQEEHAATSVNAICALAGVSKPSLYREFGNEDGLTAAVLERYAETLFGPIEAMLASPAGFAEKLEAVLRFAGEDPRLEAGCLFVKMRSTRSRFGPQTQARLAAVEARILQRYTEFFAGAAAAGEWRGDIAPELAARYLNEQIGLALSQRASGRSAESVRELLALAISVLR